MRILLSALLLFFSPGPSDFSSKKVLASTQTFTGNLSGELPEFRLTSMDGKEITTTDLKGKIVVMNFWFIACKPCVMEIPELNRLVEKYRDVPELVFLAPALDGREAILDFIQKKPFHYLLFPGSATVTREKFGISAYPTHIIADKSGKIIHRSSGYNPGNNGAGSTVSELEAIIEKLIHLN